MNDDPLGFTVNTRDILNCGIMDLSLSLSLSLVGRTSSTIKRATSLLQSLRNWVLFRFQRFGRMSLSNFRIKDDVASASFVCLLDAEEERVRDDDVYISKRGKQD